MASNPRRKSEANPKYDQRRLEVLHAAARTFNRLGYHVATLDDIAEELGVTKPALYYYVKSKEELLFACGQLALQELSTALDRIANPDATSLDRLTRFFRTYAEMICKDFGRCLAATEPRDLVSKSHRANAAGRRSMNLAVRDMIKEGIKDGSIVPCDDRAVSIALFDAFNGLSRWVDPNGPMSVSKIADQYIAMFTRGIATNRTSRNS